MPCCRNANFLPHCKNAEFAYLQALCCILFAQMINYISELQKWLKTLYFGCFCRYYKNRENRACYISITVVVVVYKVSGGTFAASQYHHPPPVATRSDNPTPTKNFLFFSQKRGCGEYRKKPNFFFLYIFLFIIYIYNIIYKYFLLFLR